MKKDNSTIKRKVRLRVNALEELGLCRPIILEPFGGMGEIFKRCYSDVQTGLVVEKDQDKADVLARQRPSWIVLEGDAVKILSSIVANNMPFNFIDIDPYGQPWPVVDAIFGKGRAFSDRLVVVVQDGLRLKLKTGGAWAVKSMSNVVAKRGNDFILKNYLDIAKDLLCEKMDQDGFIIKKWAGYYTGSSNSMTHYAAVFER